MKDFATTFIRTASVIHRFLREEKVSRFAKLQPQPCVLLIHNSSNPDNGGMTNYAMTGEKSKLGDVLPNLLARWHKGPEEQWEATDPTMRVATPEDAEVISAELTSIMESCVEQMADFPGRCAVVIYNDETGRVFSYVSNGDRDDFSALFERMIAEERGGRLNPMLRG